MVGFVGLGVFMTLSIFKGLGAPGFLQRAVYPPSMTSSLPVRNLASSEAR